MIHHVPSIWAEARPVPSQAPAGGGDPVAALRRAIARLVAAVRRDRVRARTAATLARLSDRQLDDIGLSRHDIGRVARGRAIDDARAPRPSDPPMLMAAPTGLRR
ncbi:MAG: DUF1127 domain-containing protein [Paracoccaceae bacterium]